MSLGHLLIQKCDVYRRTMTTDSYGHKISAFPTTPLYKDVPCRFEKIGNYTSTLAQTPTGQTARNEGVIFFDADADIRSGDRLMLGSAKLTVSPSLDVMDSVALHHKEIYVAIEES